MSLTDQHQRPLRNLRLSVTDRCNLRCAYCMPEQNYVWLPRRDILTFEEIARLVDVYVSLGVERVRLTGGEPLLRRDLPTLVEMLARHPGVRDLAITTNGILLRELAWELKAAGLHRVTVSLDTLDPDRFRRLARRDELSAVRDGIEAVGQAGLTGLKIDTVVMRGFNDDEIVDLLEYGRTVDAEVRFIEYMDVGGATNWSWDRVVPRDEILTRLAERYGPVSALDEDDSAPADRYRLPDDTIFGIIASTTAPFCGSCDRSRLTADGMWYLCLYAQAGVDLREPLRNGATDDELRDLIVPHWMKRMDRGAEERLSLSERRPLAGATDLRSNPHLEMHTRGG